METWVTISDYFGIKCHYQVSNYGNVRSISKKGKIKPIKPVLFGLEYLGVRLPKNGKVHSVYIHRLVALYFVNNPHGKDQVNHKDGNKKNNNALNLSWSTAKENINHSYQKGTSKTGEDRHQTKYTNDQIREIRNRYDAGLRICDICRIFGYDKSTVYLIVKRKTYLSVI